MAEKRGGPRPPDRKPRPPAGPGRFANRQDMSRITPGQIPGQPAFVPTGQPYGDRQRLLSSQQQVPVPARRAPGGGAAAAGPPARGRPAPPSPGASAAPPSAPMLPDILARPTLRPDEPVTTGLPIGPGAGPEAMVQPVPEEAGALRALLASASAPGMPSDMRAIGMLYSLVGRLRRNYARPVPAVTPEELMEPLGPGGPVPPYGGPAGGPVGL